jgi:nucleotide-binding universal stress UspA family protein
MNAPEGPVVIAFDGSPAARQAVTAAGNLLAPRQAIVVTVWEEGLAYAPVVAATDMGPMLPSIDPEAAHEVDVSLHEQAERLATEGAQLASSVGLDAAPLAASDEHTVAETIVDLARQQNAAAIVIGSRGLTGMRARLEGSASNGVVKRASCPVIVVHEAERDD